MSDPRCTQARTIPSIEPHMACNSCHYRRCHKPRWPPSSRPRITRPRAAIIIRRLTVNVRPALHPSSNHSKHRAAHGLNRCHYRRCHKPRWPPPSRPLITRPSSRSSLPPPHRRCQTRAAPNSNHPKHRAAHGLNRCHYRHSPSPDGHHRAVRG